MKIEIDIDETVFLGAQDACGITSPDALVSHALKLLMNSHSIAQNKSAPGRKMRPSLHPSPEKSPFFGQFLVQHHVINLDQLNRAIQFTRKNNPRLGDLAVRHQFLTNQQAEELHREQRTVDMFFGDLAIHRQMMTQEQVDKILSEQRDGRVRLGDAVVTLGFASMEQVESSAESFHIQTGQEEKARSTVPEDSAPETARLENYLVEYLPRMLLRLADVQARAFKLGAFTQEHHEEFHGQVRLEGPNACTLSVSLDIVLIHHILIGLFSSDYETIFEDPPYEDAISEFLSMLAASTTSQLEKSGFEYKSQAPTVGDPPGWGTGIRIETTVGSGVVIFGFTPLLDKPTET